MKIIKSSVENGNVSASILSDAAENANFMTPQEAVESSIRRFCDENDIGRILYTRVLSMDFQEDGGLLFSFEAAQLPEVKLGQYKGLKIHPGFDSNVEELAITAAAENTAVSIPSLFVERKLDTMILEEKANVLESSSVNAAADMRVILEKLLPEEDENVLWDKAVEAAVRYTESGSMDLQAFLASIVSVSGADPKTVDTLVNERIWERQRTNPEELAELAFAAYLRVNGQTEAQWRAENSAAALILCKIELMLDKIVAEEGFSVSEEELSSAIAAMSMQYQIPKDEILNLIPQEALEYQVKLGKARTLIVETAVQA